MCGIAAFVDLGGAQQSDLDAMVASIVHRGPDGAGHVRLPFVALGMRRLAIIDLSGGQQPFSNEDRTILVVANGEIYNFEAVKRELQVRGHQFHSRSDIEVIAHAYEEYGERFVDHLYGMFAIALWDARTDTLIAVRDRAGEKPLYYAETDRGLVLASEIKALLASGHVRPQLDHAALDQFLTYEYTIAPTTLFEGIHRLPPAHMLTWHKGTLAVRRYWDVAATPLRTWRDEDAVEAVHDTLFRAVDSQMMSDVPLGVFLSGGIDSSAIVAFMSRAARERGAVVNSFSMGFDDGSYDELPYAREVARLFGTNHREGRVTPGIGDLFDRLVGHVDEPFGDVSMFPTFLVSRLAREHVTVALAGDGGDELFGGYDAYDAQRLAARWQGMAPQALWRALDAVASRVPPTASKKGVINKVKRFAEGVARAPQGLGHYRWMTFAHAAAKTRLYTPALQARLRGSDVYAPVRASLARYAGDDALNRLLYADLCVYLADDILVKVDRMSMATSLETRAPFLDVDVMELAFSMPGHLKIRDGERKWVLKRALERYLPSSILQRRKEGFSIPMKQWLRAELRPLMLQLLAPERLEARGLFNGAEVRRLIDEHDRGTANHAHVLFCLMVFEHWAARHLD